MPTNQLDSLMHFAESNVFTKAGLLEYRKWLEATAKILHLQANHRSLALKHQACRGRACVLTHVGERLLCHPEEGCLDHRRQAFRSEGLFIGDCPAIAAQR